jgi:hypothetical protein
MNAGIMKFVGQAATDNVYDKNRICLFGITNWMTVMHNDILQKDAAAMDARDAPVTYEFIKPPNQGGGNTVKSEFLNPHHSHFIMVDNARQNTFGGEIPLRAKLESEIAKGDSTTRAIPVVVVVIEGGPLTVECVLCSVRQNIPCLFIDVIDLLILK